MSVSSQSLDARVVIPPVAILPRGNASAQKRVFEGRAFATDWRVAIHADRDAADQLSADLPKRIQSWLDLIDRQMSPYRDDSDLTRFNTADAWSFVPLPHVLMQVVRYALDIAALSDGAFDPTVLPAVELWGFGAKVVPEGVPAEAEIHRLRDRAYSWRDLNWQSEGMIRPEGVCLDLCAIAKGYAVDGLAKMLRVEPGVSAALVEVGGELRGFGVQPDGLPWWIEVEAADSGPASLRTVIALCDHAVATSGDLRRAFHHDGVLLSHTIDARTACPVRPEIASATVVDEHAWCADALATALIAMGETKAMAFAARHNIACLLRLRDGGSLSEWVSPVLEAWI